MNPLVSKFVDALKDADADVREMAAERLGGIGEQSAVGPLIISFVEDKNLFVRCASAKALGQIRDPSAVDVLLAGLEDEDVKEESIEALGKLGDKRAVLPLITALKNEKRSVREASAEALGLIGDARAIFALGLALMNKEPESFVFQAPAAGPLPKGDKTTVKLKDQNRYVRAAAARALGRIGDERALGSLVAVVKEEGYLPEMSGLLADLKKLSIPAQDKRGDVRKAAFNALVRIVHSNRPFMKAHPNLFCQKCRRRSTKIEFKENPISQALAVAVCPSCLNTTHLFTGITHITGVIGGNLAGLRRKAGKISLSVWNETEKSAEYADIDALIVLAEGVENYDLAVNAVILELVSDTAASERLKNVPVYVENPKGLTASAGDMLKNTFKWIQGPVP